MNGVKLGLRVALFFTLGFIAFTSCNQEPKPEKKTEQIKPATEAKDTVDRRRFPNKRSELAILMRNLIEELNANKQKVANEEPIDVKWTEKYKTILTATPTDADDSGPLFHGFGTKFLTDLKAFEEAEESNRIEVYNAMVQSCIDCHKEHCQGPIPAIKKLKI